MTTLIEKIRKNAKVKSAMGLLLAGAIGTGICLGATAYLNRAQPFVPHRYHIENVYQDRDGNGKYDTLDKTVFYDGDILKEERQSLGYEVSREELERRHPQGWEGYTHVTIE